MVPLTQSVVSTTSCPGEIQEILWTRRAQLGALKVGARKSEGEHKEGVQIIPTRRLTDSGRCITREKSHTREKRVGHPDLNKGGVLHNTWATK